MSYPDDLDDLVTVVPTNTLDEVPGFLNAASVAIEAIQAENGLNPSGSEATVKARLDAVDATIGGLGGGDLVAANNLSDLASAATSRTNLGLAGAALLTVGTTTGTVAAGDDSRIAGAAQKASNLTDLADASAARTALGLSTMATAAAADYAALAGATFTGAVVGTAGTFSTDLKTPAIGGTAGTGAKLSFGSTTA